MKIQKLLKWAAILILAAVNVPFNATAQKSFDYNHQPHAPYDFTDLNLTLSIDSVSTTIKGRAKYQLQPKLEIRDTLILHAAHMDIQEVLWNQKEIDYSNRNDSLLILPPEDLTSGEKQRLSIKYSATPKFGIHKNHRGTMWTSLLPRSHRHWFPVFDYPGNTLVTTLHIDHNNSGIGTTVVAAGEKTGGKNEWIIQENIPATAIGFAAGDFEESETMAGIKTISLYNESGIITEEQKSELLREAHSALTGTQKELGIEYPYQSLSLVVLEDHKWEQKAYGAGIGFVYLNRGNLTDQIRRIIQAQWLGVNMREEQWGEQAPTLLLQSWLAEQVFDSLYIDDFSNGDLLDSNSVEYNNFSKQNRNRWQFSLQKWQKENSRFSEAVTKTARKFFDSSHDVYNWQTYRNFLYRHTGHLWEQPPLLREPTQPDSVHYEIQYLYDDMSADLKMVFTSADSVINTLVTTRVEIKDLQGISRKEVVFSGTNDTIDVDTEGAILNAGIIEADTAHLYFNEKKPMPFWLEQLRNAEQAEKRAEAAKKLSNYADNPDLQLALLDIIDREDSDEVVANLLTTLAKITDGATGTEQQFLKKLSHGNKNVRMSAISALENYPDNDQVQRRVKRQINLQGQPEIVRTAIGVYKNIADTAEFVSYMDEFTAANTTGKFMAETIDGFIALGDTASALSKARLFLDDGYPYSVRKKMIDKLLDYPEQVDDWKPLMERLLGDIDPRIRFATVEIGKILEPDTALEIINRQIIEEYDARVYMHLKQMKHTLDNFEID